MKISRIVRIKNPAITEDHSAAARVNLTSDTDGAGLGAGGSGGGGAGGTGSVGSKGGPGTSLLIRLSLPLRSDKETTGV
jgi:hypothetical protein